MMLPRCLRKADLGDSVEEGIGFPPAQGLKQRNGETEGCVGWLVSKTLASLLYKGDFILPWFELVSSWLALPTNHSPT